MNGRSEHQIDRDFNQVVVPHSGQFSLQVSGRGCATNGQFISAVGWDIASGLDPTGVADVIKAVDSIDSEMLDDEVVRYRVFLSGQNLLAEVEGSLQYVGFYTTRTVEAGTKAEAESLALDLIRQDKKLLQMMRNKADDPPTFSIEEIVEFVDESEGRNTGFVFYLETTM